MGVGVVKRCFLITCVCGLVGEVQETEGEIIYLSD